MSNGDGGKGFLQLFYFGKAGKVEAPVGHGLDAFKRIGIYVGVVVFNERHAVGVFVGVGGYKRGYQHILCVAAITHGVAIGTHLAALALPVLVLVGGPQAHLLPVVFKSFKGLAGFVGVKLSKQGLKRHIAHAKTAVEVGVQQLVVTAVGGVFKQSAHAFAERFVEVHIYQKLPERLQLCPHAKGLVKRLRKQLVKQRVFGYQVAVRKFAQGGRVGGLAQNIAKARGVALKILAKKPGAVCVAGQAAGVNFPVVHAGLLYHGYQFSRNARQPGNLNVAAFALVAFFQLGLFFGQFTLFGR